MTVLIEIAGQQVRWQRHAFVRRAVSEASIPLVKEDAHAPEVVARRPLARQQVGPAIVIHICTHDRQAARQGYRHESAKSAVAVASQDVHASRIDRGDVPPSVAVEVLQAQRAR